MSRGLGRIQQAVVAQLMDFSHLTADDLCRLVYPGCEPTKANRDTIRRALNGLAQQKIVRQSSAFGKYGRQCWDFIGTRADHTSEREHALQARLRRAMAPPQLVRD